MSGILRFAENEVNPIFVQQLFQAAGMQANVDEDDNLVVTTDAGAQIDVNVNAESKLLVFRKVYDFKGGASAADKVAMVTNLNDKVIFVRFAMPADDALVADYFLSYEDGVLPIQILNTASLFGRVIFWAIQKYDINNLVITDDESKEVGETEDQGTSNDGDPFSLSRILQDEFSRPFDEADATRKQVVGKKPLPNTEIESFLFVNQYRHAVTVFALLEQGISLRLGPHSEPHVSAEALFRNAQLTKVETYADEPKTLNLPWDIIRFESEKCDDEHWRFMLHTAGVGIYFVSEWPTRQQDKSQRELT